MQHNSGLYHRIKNVSSPEDIEKWITERKKRYPTKANVELRKAEEVEKTQRGEIIKQKVDVTKRRKQKSSRFQNRKRTMPKPLAQIHCEAKEQKLYRGLKEFPGTLGLREMELKEENESDHKIVDDEYEESVNFISDEEEAPVPLIKPVIDTPCLPTLVADYESASDESDAPEEVPIKRARMEDDTSEESSIKKNEVQNNSEVVNNANANTELQQCSNATSQENSNTKIATISKHRHKENKSSQHPKVTEQRRIVKKKQPYTSQLLERLLSRSVQHERNLICQCIKYIVDNNFFE